MNAVHDAAPTVANAFVDLVDEPFQLADHAPTTFSLSATLTR